MTNPFKAAREAVAASLGGVGVPVHPTPPGAVSGPCAWLTAMSMDARGRVGVLITIAAPTPGGVASIEAVEQAAYDTHLALRSAQMLGWEEISPPTVDKDSGLLTRTLIASIRPVVED